MSIKTKRIGSDMAKVISNILLEEARDTLLKQIMPIKRLAFCISMSEKFEQIRQWSK